VIFMGARSTVLRCCARRAFRQPASDKIPVCAITYFLFSMRFALCIFGTMDTNKRLSRVVQWVAWVTGSLLLIFLLFMLAGHLFGDANGPNGMAFSSGTDTLGFVLFPVCTIGGLLLAYRWELLGGAVVVGSLAALCLLRPDLLRWSFVALATPGILYVVHALLTRRKRRTVLA
jgi:hypothetical protein